ncbi:FCD domain-containing protein [Clavibacter tessellarius]|uniref:FCD domain-containing protein n=1 Tax=Clavibacter tessellarius TaxID=31965 RepID=UPI00324EC2D7
MLRLQERTSDPADLARLNHDFHVALARASQNSTLASVVESMSKRVRFHYLPTATARRPDSLADHREPRGAPRAARGRPGGGSRAPPHRRHARRRVRGPRGAHARGGGGGRGLGIRARPATPALRL